MLLTLVFSLLPSSSTFKDLSDYTESAGIIQDILLISKLANKQLYFFFDMYPKILTASGA